MDYPGVSSLGTPEWIQRFYNDNEVEEADDVPFPIYLIPTEGRNVIWTLTRTLLASNHDGVASYACQLLERFLARHLRSLTLLMSSDPHDFLRVITSSNGNWHSLANCHLAYCLLDSILRYSTDFISSVFPKFSESDEWQRFKQHLKTKMLLLVAACIQLASKVHSANNRLTSQTIRRYLRKNHNMIYTLDKINEAELQIFQTLDFHIPVWTNVDKALMLAKEVGLQDSSLYCVTTLMDITDYHRILVQEIVRGVGFMSSCTSESELEQSPPQLRNWRTSDALFKRIKKNRIAEMSRKLRKQGTEIFESMMDCYFKCGNEGSSSDFILPSKQEKSELVCSNEIQKSAGENKIRNMHLVAGAVAATCYLTHQTNSVAEPIPRLAYLTRSPEHYISCIRSAIVNHVVKVTWKRKHPRLTLSHFAKKKRLR